MSGNPGGRPKSFKEFTETHRGLVPKANEVLEELLSHPDPDIRHKALKVVYDRAYGRAAQPITGEGGEGAAKVEHVDQGLLELLKKAAGDGGEGAS